MKRLLGFGLVLLAVNVVCQAGLVLLTRHIDLSFGALAGLLLIPLFQSSILVLASPRPDRATFGSTLRAIVRDRVALAWALGALVAAGMLASNAGQTGWPWLLGVLLVLLAGVAMLCHASAKGTKRLPILLAGVGAFLFALETRFDFLGRIPMELDRYPRVLVLLAIYAPLLVSTIVVLLSVERVVRERSPAAARMVDTAVFLIVAGSLVVAGNFFHYPRLTEPWQLVAQLTALLSIACLFIAGTLFLRHDRGGHEEAD